MGERGFQPGLSGIEGDQSEAPRRSDELIKGKNPRGIDDGGKRVLSSMGRRPGEEKPSSHYSQEAIEKRHKKLEDEVRPDHGLWATYMMTFPNGETETRSFSQWEMNFYKANGCKFEPAEVPGEEDWKGRADCGQ